MIEEIKKILVSEKENEIKEIENEIKPIIGKVCELEQKQMVPEKKFNFLQRSFQRNKYKAYIQQRDNERTILTQLNQQLSELNENKYKLELDEEKLNKCNTLKELGITFDEAIALLKFQGMVTVLTDEDKCLTDNPRAYNGVQDFMLVHKTRYYPKDSKIKTAKDSRIIQESSLTLNGVEHKFEYQKERDTIHFAVNDEVSSHSYGNWDSTKYSILIPFKDLKFQIEIACSVDTFTKGSVDIPSSAYILCPENEAEQIQKDNPNVHVLGYRGENVKGFSAALLSALGYRVESVGMWAWFDEESQKQFDKIIEKEGYKTGHHRDTVYREDDERREMINKISSIYKLIKEDGLVQSKDDLENIQKQLFSKGTMSEPLNEVYDKIFSNDFKLMDKLYSKFEGIGVVIDQPTKRVFENISKLELYKDYEIDSIVAKSDESIGKTSKTIDYLKEIIGEQNEGNQRNNILYNNTPENRSFLLSRLLSYSMLDSIRMNRMGKNIVDDSGKFNNSLMLQFSHGLRTKVDNSLGKDHLR